MDLLEDGNKSVNSYLLLVDMYLIWNCELFRNNSQYDSSVERLTSIFNGNGPRHYPRIQQELFNCCRQIDNVIAMETDHGIFLVALHQQKQQLTTLIEITDKIIDEELQIENAPNWFNVILPESQNPVHAMKIENHDIDRFASIITNTTEVPRVAGLNEIIGLHDVKKNLKSLVILPKTQPQLFHQRQICNTILLYGPPGTGKTRLAHGLAAEAKATFHCISAGDILSHYVGQTERTIKSLFQYLKNTPEFTILFIDEIDAFCRKRTTTEQDHTRRIKTEFMCQMSGLDNCKNTFIVCATNCPWDLDSAILRRLQKRIYVPLPNQSERLQLFKFFTNNHHFERNVDSWTRLLEKTEGYSGSDLFDLVQSALTIPLNELEDTKIWKCCEDGLYEPVVGDEDFSNVICSELRDLPPNSVRARKVQMNDLLTAAETVTYTVTQSHVKKYECFSGISGTSVI